MSATRYQLEHYPNTNCMAVHLNTRVSDKFATYGDSTFMQHPPLQWVETILAVAGVATVSVWPYYVSISKGQAFDWDDILPLVLFTLQSTFAPDGWTARAPVTWTKRPDGESYRDAPDEVTR